jgi:hypothetical protein
MPLFSIPYVEKCEKPIGRLGTEYGTQMATAAAAGMDECRVCGRDKARNGTSGLLICGRCRRIKYCSRECQREDWKEHKKWCAK